MSPSPETTNDARSALSRIVQRAQNVPRRFPRAIAIAERWTRITVLAGLGAMLGGLLRHVAGIAGVADWGGTLWYRGGIYGLGSLTVFGFLSVAFVPLVAAGVSESAISAALDCEGAAHPRGWRYWAAWSFTRAPYS